MATLKLVILKTKILSDGMTKIRISVSHNSDVRYIVTNYRIEPHQFKNGRVISHPNATILNRKLQSLIIDYEEMLDSRDFSSMSCSDVKSYLLSCKKSSYISNLFDEYIKRLNEDGKKSTAGLYVRTIRYFIEGVGDLPLQTITPSTIETFDVSLRNRGLNNTTVCMFQKQLRTVLNFAKKRGYISFKVDPYSLYKIPQSNIRELDLSIEDIRKIIKYKPKKRNLSVARDLFLLSFYLGGMNLIDILSIPFSNQDDEISYERTKTKNTKSKNKIIRISIPLQAKEIISKWLSPKTGKLDFGSKASYIDFRRILACNIKKLGKELGIKRDIVFYSARKSFVQIGFEIGISIEVLEFTIGHSNKTGRPIFNYVRIMQKHADEAIEKIIKTVIPEGTIS